MLGGRFGLVTFGSVETYRELVARHGLAGRLAGVAGVAATPPEAIADPEGVGAKVLAAVERLAAEGADSVVLAGAALAGFDRRLRARAPLSLLDGIACGVRMAEMLVALALPKPATGSYAACAGRAAADRGAP